MPGTVNPKAWLFAAAIEGGVRAESARRFATALASGGTDGVEALIERAAHEVTGPAPADDSSASRRLLAEDLLAALVQRPRIDAWAVQWADPRAAAAAALAAAHAELAALGVDLELPPLQVVARLPPPYDPPMLSVISIDRADAESFGLEPGIHAREDALLPGAGDLALGHVLVHAALGQRSPEHLGRGLEEGICEVLGALCIAARAGGADRIERTYAALRSTPSLLPHREELLAWTRAAAWLERRLGLAGLAHLVGGGRPAIKRAEAALGRDRESKGGAGDALAERCGRLLEARPHPIAVGALAFYLTRALEPGRSVAQAASALGVPEAATAAAARELTDQAFVALFDGAGRMLVSDIQLALGTGMLRYRVERGES